MAPGQLAGFLDVINLCLGKPALVVQRLLSKLALFPDLLGKFNLRGAAGVIEAAEEVGDYVASVCKGFPDGFCNRLHPVGIGFDLGNVQRNLGFDLGNALVALQLDQLER